MITRQQLSREVLVVLVVLVLFWTHSMFVMSSRSNIKLEDCNFDVSEFFSAILILEIIGNCMLTISAMISGTGLIYYDNLTQNEISDKMGASHFFQLFSFCFFFINSILTNVTFFKSNYTKGHYTTCKTDESEFSFRFITFSFAWFLFLFYVYMAFGTAYIILTTIFIALRDSNIIRCSYFLSCINKISCSCCAKYFYFCGKRINPIISIPKNDKNIQTENEIFIPIASIKNEMKPFTCIICMTNTIDVIIKPCYHICVCSVCIKQFQKQKCPCCKTEIKKVKNIYISNLG